MASGFIFWSFILLLFLFQGKNFLRDNLLSCYIIIFYLIAYFYINLGARILESIIPLILISGLNLNKHSRNVFIIAFLFFSIYLFIFGDLF